MADAAKTTERKWKTPVAMLSYPHLFVASAGPDGGKAKFSATFVFAPGADLKEGKAAAQAAGIAKFGDKFVEGVRAGKFHWPFRTDVEDKGYPAGSTFVGARSDNMPGIVSRFKGADGKATKITEEMQKPGEPGDMYPGCQVRGSLTAFAFDRNGKKGVSFALNNVQKLGEGERLDNRRAAQDEFEADLSEEPASLEDML